MSIQAVAWALEQHIEDAAAKLVLIAIANRVNTKSGECYPTIGTVCEDASQSRSTVQRKLSLLVDLGLIAKLPTSDRTGRQMANRYRLNFDVHLCRDVAGEGVTVMPHPDTEGVTVDTPEGVTGDTPIEPEKEPKTSPIAPKGAAGEGNSKAGEQDPLYGKFLHEFDPPATASLVTPLRHWAKLSDVDRALAICAIGPYRRACKAERRKMVDPSTYLSRRLFLNFKPAAVARVPDSPALAALRKALAPGFSGGVLVSVNTDEWRAWEAVAESAGYPLRAIIHPARPFAGRPVAVTGRFFPTQWPPPTDAGGGNGQAAFDGIVGGEVG